MVLPHSLRNRASRVAVIRGSAGTNRLLSRLGRLFFRTQGAAADSMSVELNVRPTTELADCLGPCAATHRRHLGDPKCSTTPFLPSSHTPDPSYSLKRRSTAHPTPAAFSRACFRTVLEASFPHGTLFAGPCLPPDQQLSWWESNRECPPPGPRHPRCAPPGDSFQISGFAGCWLVTSSTGTCI